MRLVLLSVRHVEDVLVAHALEFLNKKKEMFILLDGQLNIKLSNLLLDIINNNNNTDQDYEDINNYIVLVSEENKIEFISMFINNYLNTYKLDNLNDIKNAMEKLEIELNKFNWITNYFNISNFVYIVQYFLMTNFNFLFNFDKTELNSFRQTILDNIDSILDTNLKLDILYELLNIILKEGSTKNNQKTTEDIISKINNIEKESGKSKYEFSFPQILN